MKTLNLFKRKSLKTLLSIILVSTLFSVKICAQTNKPQEIKPLGASIGFNYTHEFANNLNGLDFSLAVQLSKKTGHRIIGTLGSMGYGNWDMFNTDYPPTDGYYSYAYADIKFMYKIVKINKTNLFVASGIGKNFSAYSSPVHGFYNNYPYTRIDITDREQIFIPLSIIGEFKIVEHLNANISFNNHFQINAPNIFFLQAGLNLNF